MTRAMENIAHTLAGFVLSRTGLGKTTRYGAAALILGSNLPDIDVVTLVRGTTAYIEHHRGITHSLLGGTLMAVLFGVGLWAWGRWIPRLFMGRDRWHLPSGPSHQREPARRFPSGPSNQHEPALRLGALVALSVVAVLGHLAFDTLNDYGIRLLLPFSDRWIYGDTIFIVDPWFWLILGGALHLGMKRGWPREILAWGGWALLTIPVMREPMVPMPARALWILGLIGLALMRWRLVASGPTVPADPAGVIVMPSPSAPADPPNVGVAASAEAWSSRLAGRIAVGSLLFLGLYVAVVFTLHQMAFVRALDSLPALAGGSDTRRLALLSRPANPALWTFVLEANGEFDVGTISSFARPQPGITARYDLNLGRPEVKAALATPLGQTAQRFCRFLFADLIELPGGEPAVAFRDARFASRNRREFSVFVVPIGSDP